MVSSEPSRPNRTWNWNASASGTTSSASSITVQYRSPDGIVTANAACGVRAERLDSGCCGLAGNFGYEPGHLDVSRACAERVLLPAVRSASPGTAILADRFSCRTQVEQLAGSGHRAVHLAELLTREV